MTVKNAFFNKIAKIMVFCVAMMGAFYTANATNLPAGYTELEYIESSGTQYIDTEFVFSENSGRIDIEYEQTQNQTSSRLFGNWFRANSNSITLRLDNGKYALWAGKTELFTNGVIDSDINVKHSVSNLFDNGVVTVTLDGINYTGTYENSISTESANYLFAMNYSQVYGGFIGKIYSCKIWDGNTLVRNFVPAKNASGVVGMYDTVSGTFFTNSGTGEFVAGPAKCRNLFDKTTIIANKYINSSGVVTSDGTNRTVVSDKIYVKPNTTYTLSGTGDIYGARYYRSGFQYAADNTPIAAIPQSSGTVTFTTAENCAYVRVMSVTNSVNTAQLELGSAATDYVPYCVPVIKIATNAYNDAQFAPVETALANTVATIKDVVSNTITQTSAIAQIASDKQTRPDSGCPAFRQCLLVEDEDGTPHWYQIKDPVHDLVLSLKNNKVNSAGETTTTAFAANGYDGTNGTTNSIYYIGYPAMRNLADGSTDVSVRQFTSDMLNGTNGGQYKTLGDQEWAVTWDGNETGTANSFLPGVIYGTSRCAKTKPSSTAVGTAGWNTIETSDPLKDTANIQEYSKCFCKMTGVGMDGDITPVKNASAAPWVFNLTASSAVYCAYACAYYCARDVRDIASFRQQIMNWAVE